MSKTSHSIQSFKRLFKYFGNHRKDFYLGALFSFLNKAFDVAPEILIGIAIDVVVSQEKSFLAQWGVEEPIEQIYILALFTLIIWACESLFEYLYNLKWRGLAQSIQHEFRTEAYNHLQKLDMSYFEDKSTGTLVSTLNDDINQLERFFNVGMNSLVQVFTAVLLIGIVFFVLAPHIAIFSFLPMPLILWGAFYFQKKAAPLYLSVREKAGIIGARLANNIAGMATIRSFNSEALEQNKVAEDSLNYLQANREAIAVSSAFTPIIRMAILAGFLATFVLGGRMALQGDLNVGFYGVLVFLTQRLLWPLTGLAETLDLFERAMASADRVLDLIKTPVKIEQRKEPKLYRHEEGLSFKDLRFSYQEGFPILNGVNIEVPEGKTIAIVGPTGSGKSTITKLLLKFYELDSGEIKLGGQNIKDADPKEIRSQIGIVSQDVYLFPGTVFENIAYANPTASREEVIAAAKKAHAWEFIKTLPQGLDTLIGERGQKLSGGQRQRLSIARILLKNPPVLILDEATSSVDNETEALIQASLAEATKNRTTIVIAHRLSTIIHSDKIYVLASGRVVEEGTHSELIKQAKVYYELWNAPKFN
ncbi:MAG TPA: ABC transporter ATP-binding protein [Bacteriovoracaceae bacterium]|nr:ABC transporter ATP-binding protein [Bacteriovoracaceae bacterium]